MMQCSTILLHIAWECTLLCTSIIIITKFVHESALLLVCEWWLISSLVPSLPRILNVARRERREPGKIYHVRDVGVEATWSAARANHDSALSER